MVRGILEVDLRILAVRNPVIAIHQFKDTQDYLDMLLMDLY
jgi:hypothetical protein